MSTDAAINPEHPAPISNIVGGLLNGTSIARDSGGGLESQRAKWTTEANPAEEARTQEVAVIAQVLEKLLSEEGKYWLSKRKGVIRIWVLADLILVPLYVAFDDLRAWTRLYGATAAIALASFGSKSIWKMQTEVLSGSATLGSGGGRGGPDDMDSTAVEFKKITQDESSRIGVSGSIVTSVAVTALGLPNLSQTHWVASAAYLFSLVSALLAVYYAGSQVWKVGRLTRESQVKAWIRNGDVSTLERVFTRPMDEVPHASLILRTLVPAPSSVLIVSAPGVLLSAALYSLLIGFGVYVGCVWVKELNISAGPDNSRNVFIIYLVGLFVCYGVYAVSGLEHEKLASETVRGVMGKILAELPAKIEKSDSERLELQILEQGQKQAVLLNKISDQLTHVEQLAQREVWRRHRLADEEK